MEKAVFDHHADRRAYWNAREVLDNQPINILGDMRPGAEIAGELFARCMAKLIGVQIELINIED